MNVELITESGFSDVAPRPADTGLGGHYEPNFPGATSLRDAKPMWVDGQHVTVEVTDRDATIFLGCKIIFSGPLPEKITHRDQINSWAAQYVLTFTAEPEVSADESDDLAPWERELMGDQPRTSPGYPYGIYVQAWMIKTRSGYKIIARDAPGATLKSVMPRMSAPLNWRTLGAYEHVALKMIKTQWPTACVDWREFGSWCNESSHL